jgi:hypothetical protein
MLPMVSHAIMNLDVLEICREVSTELLDFSKLHSLWPVIVAHRRITSPKVEAVATMSPTAFVAIERMADL